MGPAKLNIGVRILAHPDLVYPGYLKGGEPVEITNMHPGGTMTFKVPQVKLATAVTVAERSVQPQFNLETLIIEPGILKLSMVWRAAMQCDKKALEISEIKITTIK